MADERIHQAGPHAHAFAIPSSDRAVLTSYVYASSTSEEYLGRANRNNVSRDKMVIATKVFFNEGRLSKAAIQREIDGSLARLGMDYLDLYIIHSFDAGAPVGETMEALDKPRGFDGRVSSAWLDSLFTGAQVTDMDIDSAVRLTEVMSLAYGR